MSETPVPVPESALAMAPNRDVTIVFCGNFRHAHCTEVHLAKTLEALGYTLVRLQEDKYNCDQLIAETLKADADLFIYQRTWGFVKGSHGHDGFWLLNQLREHGIPSASYHLDLYLGLDRDKTVNPTTDPFWATDIVFTADGGEDHSKEFARRGVNHVFMSPAVYHGGTAPGKFVPEMGHEIVFVGTSKRYHKEWPYRERLIRALKKHFGHRFVVYGNDGDRPNVREEPLNNLYASAQVVVGDSLYSPGYWSDRYFETIGRGGFLIAPMVPGLEKFLTPGEHFVAYDHMQGRRTDFTDLFALIEKYLIDIKAREKIRKAGYEHVRDNHTYAHRMAETIAILQSRGRLKTPPRRLDVGCGLVNPRPKWEHIDSYDFGTNVVHDLEVTPWPYDDETFDEIHADDVLEHLNNNVGAINELIRVLKVGGVGTIQVPDARHAERTWADPEHKRGYMPNSLDYWVRGSGLEQHYGARKNQGKYFIGGVKLEARNQNLTFTFRRVAP